MDALADTSAHAERIHLLPWRISHPTLVLLPNPQKTGEKS
jgi:hypothetical protein